MVLIIAPWNFPFNLTLGPLVSAIAAGNCAILKPSEMTPASTACMQRILGELFDENEVAIVEGDASVAEALLRKKFDHIFFTGSPAVGKIVMKAAAEHLTSVTLELGGKSPAIVDSHRERRRGGEEDRLGQVLQQRPGLHRARLRARARERARRVPRQSCARPIEALGDASRGMIVNERHAARVKRLIDQAVARGRRGRRSAARPTDATSTPTVLTNVPPDAAVMQEEIFGPVLPVLTYRSLDEAFDIIDGKEQPLVLYIFSRDRKRGATDPARAPARAARPSTTR